MHTNMFSFPVFSGLDQLGKQLPCTTREIACNNSILVIVSVLFRPVFGLCTILTWTLYRVHSVKGLNDQADCLTKFAKYDYC